MRAPVLPVLRAPAVRLVAPQGVDAVMADATIYSIRRLGRTRANGITAPVAGSLNAVIKFDSPESEHCVYNELVAVRLAQTLHIPIADGVLTAAGTGHAFASLELAAPGLPLPDVPEGHHGRVAELYPDAVASLVAFDIWIGNSDRARNFKASLVTPHVPVFRGFDHSHALLGIEASPPRCLRQLREGDLIAETHPFFGKVKLAPLAGWVKRIQSIPDDYIRECCEFGRPIGAVTVKTQKAVSQALLQRRIKLGIIIQLHMGTVRARP